MPKKVKNYNIRSIEPAVGEIFTINNGNRKYVCVADRQRDVTGDCSDCAFSIGEDPCTFLVCAAVCRKKDDICVHFEGTDK